MTHIMLAESTAVMRPVQLALDFVQLDCEPRAVGALNLRAQVAQQRLDLAPMKVAAGRFGEDRFQNALVLVTHRCNGGSRIEKVSGASLPKNQEIAANGELPVWVEGSHELRRSRLAAFRPETDAFTG